MSQPLTVAHRSGQLAYPKKERCGGVGKRSKLVDPRHSVESRERQRENQEVLHCTSRFVRFAIRRRRILKSRSGLARELTIDIVKSALVACGD
jgi:hypothetical protein